MSNPIRGLAARALAATVLAAAIAAAGAGPALAHASLSSSSPVAHAEVSGNPPYVDLRFSSAVIGAEQIQVHDGAGHGVAVGATELLEGGRRMRARIPTLTSGDYVVDWRGLSADGHLSLGRYGFSIGVAGRQVGTTGGGVPVMEAAVRWVYLMALLVAFGARLTRSFTWMGMRTVQGRPLPSLPVPAILTVATFGAMAQAALVVRRSGFAIGDLPVLVALLQAVMVTGGLWLATHRPGSWVLLPALGATVVAAALGGHSVTSNHWWGAPANAVHLLAVATWTGGLAQVVLAGWRLRAREDLPALMAAVRKYAGLALASVIAAVLTGLLTAAAEFGSIGQLTDSGYGRVLLLKVALVGLTLLLALAARLGGIPRSRPTGRPRLLRRLVRVESALLAAVVAAAALLANTAPPQLAVAAPDIVPVPVLRGPVVEQVDFDGRYLVRLRVSADTVLVQLQDAAGRPPAGSHVDIFTVTPDYDDLNVYPRSCGAGCAAGDYPLQAGSTAFLVVARTSGRESTVAFAVRWPPALANPAVLAAARDALARTEALPVREQRTTAAGTVAMAPVTLDGKAALSLLGLDSPTLEPLPYQPRPDQLLLRDGPDTYVELDLDGGSPVHEVVTSPAGRVERFLG